MKALLITHQIIDVRENGCWCNFALYGTLSNIKVLGDLYVLASRMPNNKKVAQPITEQIDYLLPDHVFFLESTNRLQDYFKNAKNNRKSIEQLVKKMDVVVGYAPSGAAQYAMKIAHSEGIPFITFLVGCPWETLRHHHRLLARLVAPLSYWGTKKMVRDSEYVHYVTHSFLQQRYPTKGKVLSCSDINLGEMDPDALSRRLKIRESRSKSSVIRLVTVGSIDAGYKGQDYVIRAIARLKKQGNTLYHYYLVGGQKGNRLRALCKQLDVEDQVHFLGVKTIEEVFSTLDDCDIYLQPSLTEGLPRSVIEAMSRALPCIGFRTGGIPELLEPQYIVKQKNVDGIVKALGKLEDENEYCRVAERNFKEAQSYEHSLLQKTIRDFFLKIKREIENNKVLNRYEVDRKTK